MSIKTSAFITAHYPNTYMEQLCRALHPNLELGTICVSWFRQATKHCTELMTDVKAPTTYFWSTVKNFIFPERRTELSSTNKSINIHPTRLSIEDCQSLFLDMVNDYIERAPRYAAESATNALLWQVLYSLMGIMVMGTLLLATIFFYKKFIKPMQKQDLLAEIFKPEKRLKAIAKRSLRLAKAEVRQLHVQPVAKPEELVAPDGTDILVMKVRSKLEFFNAVVTSTTETSAKLYRSKPKSEFKTDALTKAMKFLDNNSKKLRLLLLFDDDPIFEEDLVEQRTSKSPPSDSLSTRSQTVTSKRILPTALGGSKRFSASQKVLAPTTFGFGSNSPRSNSPRIKQTTTLGSGNTVTSAIPRNISKLAAKTTELENN